MHRFDVDSNTGQSLSDYLYRHISGGPTLRAAAGESKSALPMVELSALLAQRKTRVRKPKQYTIQYPTGRTFVLTGFLRMRKNFDLTHYEEIREPSIATGKEKNPGVAANPIKLDPRAFITGPKGETVYDPRENRQLSTPTRQWLTEHPEWPPRQQ